MLTNQKSILVWIDKKIDNNENKVYLKEFEEMELFDIFTFKNEDDGLKKIKEIKFRKTFLILSGSVYQDFIIKFINQINDIFVIPIIIIFTWDKYYFIEKNKNIEQIFNNRFYNLGGIQSSFKPVKDFIENLSQINNYFQHNNSMCQLNNIDEKIFIIDKIDKIEQLFLPLYYKTLIEIS